MVGKTRDGAAQKRTVWFCGPRVIQIDFAEATRIHAPKA
jgi:hypothetical protein